MMDAVRKLIEKWREEVGDVVVAGPVSRTLTACADELEAALRACKPEPCPACEHRRTHQVYCTQCGFTEYDDEERLDGCSCAHCGIGPMRPVGED